MSKYAYSRTLAGLKLSKKTFYRKKPNLGSTKKTSTLHRDILKLSPIIWKKVVGINVKSSIK